MRSEGLVRSLIVFVVLAITVAAAVVVFLVVPGTLVDLLGILLVLAAGLVGLRIAGNLARSVAPGYDVAEVAVEGPITRDGGGGPLPSSPHSTPADDVVEQIERADADGAVEALVVKLNTPGGEVVPSDDIKRAAERFEGPTIAYATDTCASGGYWIASGCDELWAREASVVGSIGVIGSRVNAADLVDRIGLSYERFAAGEFKDAGVPLREIEDDERDYLQGLIDDVYETFVERVSEGRELDPAFVEETEARVYLGAEAYELGLVDHLGTRRDLERELADRLDTDEVTVETFEPPRRLLSRVGTGAQSVAYSFGVGLASVLDGDRSFRIRI